MERLVPPHAPVGPFNASTLPVRWEFSRYTSFQSRQPQKCSFIFLLKSITNLEQGVDESVDIQPGFCLRGFVLSGCRKPEFFRWCQWHFFQPTGDKRKTWELKQTAVLCWLTGGSFNSQVGLPSLGDFGNCLYLCFSNRRPAENPTCFLNIPKDQ